MQSFDDQRTERVFSEGATGQIAVPAQAWREIHTIQSSVEQKGGRIVEVMPPMNLSIEVAAALEDLRRLATGETLRPEGLTFYPTDKPPAQDTLDGLMENVHLDQGCRFQREGFFRGANDPRPVWGEAGRLYHGAKLINYLVMRHVGWIDPMDLEWAQVEKFGTEPMGAHYGFSLSTDLRESIEYAEAPRAASFAERLYRACDREIPEALKGLLNKTVVLAMDADGLKSAFPSGEVLWPGFEIGEVCCPILPAATAEVGLTPLAIIEWPKRS